MFDAGPAEAPFAYFPPSGAMAASMPDRIPERGVHKAAPTNGFRRLHGTFLPLTKANGYPEPHRVNLIAASPPGRQSAPGAQRTIRLQRPCGNTST